MLQLYGQIEFAKEIGWTKNKLAVYLLRGKLPEPYAMAGSRPLWKKEQTESFKSSLK